MKKAIHIDDPEHMGVVALSISSRNTIIRTAPPAYKNVIMTLLVGMTGKLTDEVLDAMRQLADLREWDKVEERPCEIERGA